MSRTYALPLLRKRRFYAKRRRQHVILICQHATLYVCALAYAPCRHALYEDGDILSRAPAMTRNMFDEYIARERGVLFHYAAAIDDTILFYSRC